METARAIALFLLVDTFPGFYGDLLKSGRQPFAAFQSVGGSLYIPVGGGEDVLDGDGGDDLRDGGEGGDLL